MAEHLRFGVCYWHSFAWDGSDIFGAGTLDRPWNPATASGAAAALEPMDAAKLKMDAAFEFFEKLGAPFFSFHDVDIAPAGATFAESARNLDEMVDLAGGTHGAHGHPAAVGHDERVLASALHGAAPPPTPTRRCSSTPPPRSHTA